MAGIKIKGGREMTVDDVSGVMPKKYHRVFVRESGPDAWGASVRVTAGCLYRRSKDGGWTVAEEDGNLWMEYEDSHLEVFDPQKHVIDVYDAYGD